jgi:membrane protein YdbS with pleckstrin-like domain
MALFRKKWEPGQADEWTIHDLLAGALAVISYAAIAVGTAGALLAQAWGFVALAVGVVCVVALYLVIDPKLRAMSRDFAARQDEYLRHVERTTRWEQ